MISSPPTSPPDTAATDTKPGRLVGSHTVLLSLVTAEHNFSAHTPISCIVPVRRCFAPVLHGCTTMHIIMTLARPLLTCCFPASEGNGLPRSPRKVQFASTPDVHANGSLHPGHQSSPSPRTTAEQVPVQVSSHRPIALAYEQNQHVCPGRSRPYWQLQHTLRYTGTRISEPSLLMANHCSGRSRTHKHTPPDHFTVPCMVAQAMAIAAMVR